MRSRRNPIASCLLLAGLALLLGATPPASASAPNETGEASITSDNGIAARLLAIRSELEIGLELLDRGETDRAVRHLLAPLEELWTPIHEPLERRDRALEIRLEAVLAQAASAEPEEMGAAAEKALVVVEEASRRLFPERLREDPRFCLAIARVLLDDSARAYTAAVPENGPIDRQRYETAFGLGRAAADLLTAVVRSSGDRETRAAVERLLASLAGALPAVEPPVRPLPAGRFQALVSRIELQFGSLV